MESPSLANVPAEILYLIIQSLDPISLINLSQTSTLLRWFINPKPTHFVQRLLALELTPKHGGIVPLFRARDNTISPPTDCQNWELNKYACTGCMKLLPHQMFDNHSILGLGLRKPPPGSEESEKLTDWEPPGNKVARWKRLQSRGPAECARLEKWRQQYIWAIRCNRQLVNGFLAVPENDTQDDTLAEEAEKVLCGRSRHKRLCIECKRKRGVHYARRNRSNIGSTEIPIIKSRRVHFRDKLSRYFPRTIYPDIPEPPSPRTFQVQRPEARSFLNTKLIIFCRHCSTWQELSDLSDFYLPRRQELHLPVNPDPNDPGKTKILSELRCYHCFASEYGFERLGNELFNRFERKAQDTLDDIRGRLHFGWERMCLEFCEEGGVLNKHKYKATLGGIFGPCREKDPWKIGSRFEFSCEYAYGSMEPHTGIERLFIVDSAEDSHEEERRALRGRLKRLRKFLDKELDPADRDEVTDSWQGSWLEDYEDNEECLFYILEVKARIKENRWLLVEYALNPDHFRYPRPPLTTEQHRILTDRGEAQQKLAMEWSTNRLPYYRRLVKKSKPWRINPGPDDSQDKENEEYDESSEDPDELMNEYDQLGDEFDAAMSLRDNKGKWKREW